MKKLFGNYTTDAAKAFKGCDHIYCRVEDEDMIYISNGYLVYRMAPEEYTATVQPATQGDAGNWDMDHGKKRAAGPNAFDLIATFRRMVAQCTGEPLQPFPAIFPYSKGDTVTGYYNPAGFAAFCNRRYTAPLAPSLTARAKSSTSPVVFFDGEEPVAVVLPIRAKEEYARAVKAYFVPDQGPEQSSAELESLRNYYADEQRKTAEQAAEIEKLRAELDALRAEKAAALGKIAQIVRMRQKGMIAACEEVKMLADTARDIAAEHATEAEQAPMTEKPDAESIAARFAGLDGVHTTIKGANTAAPVVWLAGDIAMHIPAIKAAGGVWSCKKRAYYIRVA